MDRLPFASERCCLTSLICIRPHMRASPSSYFFIVGSLKRERGGAVRFSPKAELSLRQGISLQTSHPAGRCSHHSPTFGTGELQEGGTTL
jgi:hypothetical protein